MVWCGGGSDGGWGFNFLVKKIWGVWCILIGISLVMLISWKFV